MSAPLGVKQLSFAVPVTAGNYAPEILYTNVTGTMAAGLSLDWFDRLVLLVLQLPATSQIEVDLLRPGLDPNAGDASYYLAGAAGVAAITTTGFKGNILGTGVTSGWWGARIRAKSGGTLGTAIIGANWGCN